MSSIFSRLFSFSSWLGGAGTAPEETEITAAKTDALPVYTKAEIEVHGSESDCWIIINDLVYDITDFVPEHPGGDIIMARAGDDSTEQFDEVGHSEDAHEMLADFLVGRVA